MLKLPLRILSQFSKLISPPYSLIAIVAIVSTYKALSFYFWRDDFTIFYGIRLNDPLLEGVYVNFWLIFGPLYKIFGYTPFFYFLVGILLFVFASIVFYLFSRKLIDKTTAIFISLIFATGYIGAGVFVETWDPITTFPSLGLLLLSLVVFYNAIKNGLQWKLFLLGLIILGFSEAWFYARSITYIFPVILFIFLYSKKISLNKKIVLSVAVFLSFVVTFFVIPGIFKYHLFSPGSSIGYLGGVDFLKVFNFSLQSLSSLVFTDSMQSIFFPLISQSKLLIFRIFLGSLILLSFVYFIFNARNNKDVLKVRIFAFFWMMIIYAPFGLRVDWRMESTHRYLVFSYPGFLVFWATLTKFKFWKVISLGVILFYIYSSNLFLNVHLDESLKQAKFFKDLHNQLASISPGSVFFFDSAPAVSNQMGDFFRAGSVTSEAVLGTEYGMNYRKIELITDNDLIKRRLIGNQVKLSNLFTFYYDGKVVTDTTKQSRDFFNSKQSVLKEINLGQKTQFLQDLNLKQWTGTNEGINFGIEGFETTLPSKLLVKVVASAPDFPMPYTQACHSCQYNPGVLAHTLEHLTLSKTIKSGVTIQASSAGDNTVAEALIDGDYRTRWTAYRQEWIKGVKPVIKISFSNESAIEGMILHVHSQRRKPTAFNISVNGKSVKYKINDMGKDIKLLIDPIKAKDIEMMITSTSDEDSPVIDEIEFIAPGFSDIDVANLHAISESPASMIKTAGDKEALLRYLSVGTNACLQWEVPGYGKGEEGFDLVADGMIHEYSINLPSMGLGDPKFKLSCLNFPAEVTLLNAGQVSLK